MPAFSWSTHPPLLALGRQDVGHALVAYPQVSRDCTRSETDPVQPHDRGAANLHDRPVLRIAPQSLERHQRRPLRQNFLHDSLRIGRARILGASSDHPGSPMTSVHCRPFDGQPREVDRDRRGQATGWRKARRPRGVVVPIALKPPRDVARIDSPAFSEAHIRVPGEEAEGASDRQDPGHATGQAPRSRRGRGRVSSSGKRLAPTPDLP